MAHPTTEEMAEKKRGAATPEHHVPEVSIRVPERVDIKEEEPEGTADPDPEGAVTGGTDDTTEEEERGAEDEEITEGSRVGEDTSVTTGVDEVSDASLTGGILRFRARYAAFRR